ncbi:MaoC family dehydratase [Nocardioides panacisoli]|uniref:MaoC family dehydratase n=1 Tax=Nocardioides panacisoli TaxID=627624 RepID=UPI001C62CF60|nr:MaoC family dehydratase [Nocardioides panacisoli]QYJ03565.1 MaoC family dehydratase [Nocardioides panacisoli]
MAHTFHGVDAFRSAAGQDLGAGPWFVVDQGRIDAFADVTEDWQWIHVDPERAATSDLGGTIAHGYLTLSLLPRLSSGIFDFDAVGRAVNYGLDRVRFPASVHAGERIRARAELVAVDDTGAGALGRVRYTVEVDGGTRPACVAEALMLVLPEPTSPGDRPIDTPYRAP